MATIIALVAAAASIASAAFIWIQAREIRSQTDLQRAVAETAAQPYIWADVRLQSSNGWNLEFVVGNSGPTIATNIRVSITPPFPLGNEGIYLEAMHTRFGCRVSVARTGT